MKNLIFGSIILILMISCERVKTKKFESFLAEPCMIVNYQQDNTKEGDYLIVESIDTVRNILVIDLPDDFYIGNVNCENWVFGWGEKQPYYNAGVENIRMIERIKGDSIFFGKIKRGQGYPDKGQYIAFWNKRPSGFENVIEKNIVDPDIWPDFSGQSISFGGVAFDSVLQKWVMVVNEVDTSKIQIYAALSDNLVDWEAANDGNPILIADDFKNCTWAGIDESGVIFQTPLVSDIIRFKKKWFLFMDGYSINGKRHIGIAVSENTLVEGYKIYTDPVLMAGERGEWNEKSSFYAKVARYKDGFIMFYDGRDNNGLERIGMATSKDLVTWINSEQNPVISQHEGWRSYKGCTEPCYVEIREDTILLLIEGVKKFNNSIYYHYITKDRNMGRSGNVSDGQLGIYMSVNWGGSFVAHSNNPVFVNDYSSEYENEHMGGNFELIKTDSSDFIIYQAKNSNKEHKYSILIREKRKGI